MYGTGSIVRWVALTLSLSCLGLAGCPGSTTGGSTTGGSTTGGSTTGGSTTGGTGCAIAGAAVAGASCCGCGGGCATGCGTGVACQPGACSFCGAGQSPTFGLQASDAAGSGPVFVAVGDFNGDGRPDLAVADEATPATLGVLMNGGGGTFGAPVPYVGGSGLNPWSVALGDFNGDGKPDLAVANKNDGTVSVLLNGCQ